MSTIFVYLADQQAGAVKHAKQPSNTSSSFKRKEENNLIWSILV
jgi:hypothetical protein